MHSFRFLVAYSWLLPVIKPRCCWNSGFILFNSLQLTLSGLFLHHPILMVLSLIQKKMNQTWKQLGRTFRLANFYCWDLMNFGVTLPLPTFIVAVGNPESLTFIKLQPCEMDVTIIPQAWMGYWLRGHEGKRNNNCFSKMQLVDPKYWDKTTLVSKTWCSRHCFGFQSQGFSLLVGYNI